MTRLPIRVRLALGFALAMAIVLSAVGVFVYQRVGNELLASVDQTLASQSKDQLSHEHVDTEHLLGYLTSGGLLGQLALLDGLPSSASAHLQRPL